MDYVRTVDPKGFSATERISQHLLGRRTGGETCRIECIQVPPGGGSPAGLHTHVFDQIYYCVKGTMDLEIGGEHVVAPAGSVVFLPKGVPHKNWNATNEPIVHLAMQVPEVAEGQSVSFPA